jgi:cobalt-zinc-cadmium efflux system protein
VEAVLEGEAVHDLHAWSLPSGINAVCGPYTRRQDGDSICVLWTFYSVLKERFKIDHTTIQLEEPTYAEQCKEAQHHS